uniref:WD repeat domain 43 n=2 Tax=Cyprinus carpio TaxID=7962 RepID=A0A8C1H4R9_CYPCA
MVSFFFLSLQAFVMAADGGRAALPCAFSPKSQQFLALCAQDGRLRIWNTDSKTLQQEYVPSAHLSSACTCVTWGPCRAVQEVPQRKRRKCEAGSAPELSDLLALGTAAGSVLIYSTVKGDLHCTLEGGHSGPVNSVQWHPEDSVLYSGSDDTHIAEWDLQTGKVRCKWKADRSAVSSLCISPDGKLLLSAGMTIKMWNLETKEVYRKFTGHSTMVTTLCFTTTRPPDSNGMYFLSGAAHDRLLSVWYVRSDGKDKNSVVSFTLTDEPQHIDLQTSNCKDEPVRLAVVCKDGQLHLFEHFLNGPCKKPLSPVCSLQVSTMKGDSPVPVPLLAAALRADRQNLMLAYGHHLQPVMEKTPFNTSERHICLVRDVHGTLSLSVDTAVSKVKTPVVNKQSKVLVPGLPGHKAPIKLTPNEAEKRKKEDSTTEMSIEERLEQIELSVGGRDDGKGTSSLQTDSFAVLLVQGLESNDQRILAKIFQTKKEMLIKNTVARLPPQAVLPLLEEVFCHFDIVKYWFKAVLTQHTSYLSSLPDLVSQLGSIYHMIESRVKLYQQLTRLHGKLYLLMTQVATNNSAKNVDNISHKAKLVYEEESSDEDEDSRDEGCPEDDSDNWEEDEAAMELTEDKKNHKDEEDDEEDDMNDESKANGDSDLDPENESEEE